MKYQTVHAGYVKVGDTLYEGGLLLRVRAISREYDDEGNMALCFTCKCGNSITRDYRFRKYANVVLAKGQ